MASSSIQSNISGISLQMTGATANAAGASGSVPTPPALGTGSPKALLSDGTWGEVAGSDTVQTLTATGIVAAWSSLVLADATAGDITVTLPAASGNVGKTVKVVKTDASSNTVTVAANGGNTMNSIVSLVLAQQNQTLTIEAATTSTVRTVANMANAVLAEYGAVAIDNQIFSTDTFVNSTNGVYALPSAGIWLLTYDLSTDGTGANATSQVAIHSPTGTVVPNTERTRGGSVTTAAPLTCTALISTTGPATYRLVGRRGGSGTMTITDSATNQSTISWHKVGGFAPIEGQLVDYVSGTLTTDQTTNLGAGQHVKFDTQSNGNIFLDTASAYSSTNGVASIGRITLTAGKTYKLSGQISAATNSSSGLSDYQWFNATTGTVIPGASKGWIISPANTSTHQRSGISEAIFTPTVDTLVELRILGAITSPIGGDSGTSFFIQQLGSSAYNTLNAFDGATSVLDGAAGGVPTPLAGEQDEFLRGNGTWSKPVFSGARRFASAATSIPNTGTATLVTTGTVDYTAGADVTTATANTITIATTGYYRITGSVGIATGSTTANYHARILVGGTTVAQGGNVTSVADTQTMQVTTTQNLTAGDLVTLGASQISGGAQNTVSGTTRSYLEVEFLGV